MKKESLQQATDRVTRLIKLFSDKGVLFSLDRKQNAFVFISVSSADLMKVVYPKSEINTGLNGKRYAEVIINYE